MIEFERYEGNLKKFYDKIIPKKFLKLNWKSVIIKHNKLYRNCINK